MLKINQKNSCIYKGKKNQGYVEEKEWDKLSCFNKYKKIFAFQTLHRMFQKDSG